MHSVAPQQTVTLASASHSMPLNALALSAIAWRRSAVPQVMAYWLKPSGMAWHAASFISSGGSKSGIPWPRLTAPCSSPAGSSRG